MDLNTPTPDKGNKLFSEIYWLLSLNLQKKIEELETHWVNCNFRDNRAFFVCDMMLWFVGI